jgi:hypothetical protein
MRELAEAIVLSDELRKLGRTGSDMRHHPVK